MWAVVMNVATPRPVYRAWAPTLQSLPGPFLCLALWWSELALLCPSHTQDP